MRLTPEDIRRIAVRSIQERLLALSRIDPDIPRVNPDSIYGPQTAASVKAFQIKYRLPASGKVDFDSWKALETIYNDSVYLLQKPDSADYFFLPLSGDSLSEGEISDTAAALQIMLNTISEDFNSIPALTYTGQYDPATSGAVREFQNATGLPVNGIVDKATWNAITRYYNKRRDFI